MHQDHQAPANRQSQAGAAELARGRTVHLRKRFEDQLLLVRRDPDASVAHGKLDLAAVLALGPLRQRQRDTALLRKFDRVAEQVDEHLAQPTRVALDATRQVRRHFTAQHQALLLGSQRHRADRFAHQLVQVKRHFLEIELARFDLGEIQDLVDDREQRIGRGLDQRNVIALLRFEL